MPAVLPLMRAALRLSTRRRSSTPRKRREAPSIPVAGQNVACKSPAVRICVEGLLITLRAGRFCHALVYGNQVFPRICRSQTAACATRRYEHFQFSPVVPQHNGHESAAVSEATTPARSAEHASSNGSSKHSTPTHWGSNCVVAQRNRTSDFPPEWSRLPGSEQLTGDELDRLVKGSAARTGVTHRGVLVPDRHTAEEDEPFRG